MSWVTRCIRASIDFVVPDACQICGRVRRSEEWVPEPAARHRATVEVPLVGGLRVRNRPFCPECLRRLEPSASPESFLIAGTIRVIAPFRTNATLLAIAHRIKFSRFPSLCAPVAAAMAAAWDRSGARVATLVPVPMDARSRHRRGFNPAELLAKEVAAITGMRIDAGALEKVRRTKPQSLTPRRRRHENIRDAYRSTCRREDGEALVIVDDLVTTGATATVCAGILVRAGGNPVAVLCGGESL